MGRHQDKHGARLIRIGRFYHVKDVHVFHLYADCVELVGAVLAFPCNRIDRVQARYQKKYGREMAMCVLCRERAMAGVRSGREDA